MAIEAGESESSAITTSRVVLDPWDEEWVLRPPRGMWRAKALRIISAFRDPAVAIPGFLLIAIVLSCFLGPLTGAVPNPDVGNFSDTLLPIGSHGYVLGTNQLGNDMFSRLLYGGRVSIVVGISATAIGTAIGTVIGMTAGYLGGTVEATIMRLLDTLLAFPGLILALSIASFLGASEWHTIMAISVFGVATYGRLARSQTLNIRHRDYVVAARSNGAGARRIIFGHILPNIIAPLLAFAMITVGVAMLIEAGLSFLGLGIPLPQPSWGNMIASGQSYLSNAPQLIIEPSVALFVTVFSLNLLADSLRRRLRIDR
jgi:peptide/nickel transport system permease protein